MIYKEQPIDFVADMEVVGCLIGCDDKILLLHRQDHKIEGNKWDLPAGKVDKTDSNIRMAILREIKEETGLIIKDEDLNFYKTFCVSHLGFNFFYHYFNTKLKQTPDVIISKMNTKNLPG